MRGVVEIEEDARGPHRLVITELPYQVNHDNFITSIAEQVRDGKLAGISNIEDQCSDRVGLADRRGDQARRRGQGGAEQPLQAHPAADQLRRNMLSIVDGVPRTLRLDQMIRYYVDHQLDVIVRRTTYRLRKANERAHILRGLVKALDALDEVIALIRASETVDIARAGLIELLDIDEIQAQAILDMQLRRLAALERQRIVDDLAKIEAEIADLEDILAKPERQRLIVRDELNEIVDKYGDDRRTRIIAADGEVVRRGPDRPRGRRRDDHRDRLRQAHQDRPVPQPETRRQGCAGRRAQAGRHRAALLRVLDPRLDPVLHHAGPGLPRQGLRPAGGLSATRAASTSPTCWRSSPRSASPRSSRSRATRTRPYLVLATRNGLVKKSEADRLRLQPLRRHRGGQPA